MRKAEKKEKGEAQGTNGRRQSLGWKPDSSPASTLASLESSPPFKSKPCSSRVNPNLEGGREAERRLNQVREHLWSDAVQNRTPHTVDVIPTAKCDLECSMCWGPDHNMRDELTTENWCDILTYLATNGTRSITISGGEPLIRKDIGQIVQVAHALGLRPKLSTNTTQLAAKADEVLPYLAEIGIPIDGSTRDRNASIRAGNPAAFDTALAALYWIPRCCPNLSITVRTVVSAKSRDDVVNIGSLLVRRGNSVRRWKLYEFTPVSIGAQAQGYELPDGDFDSIVDSVRSRFPQLRIEILRRTEQTGRYTLIFPDGSIRTDTHEVIGTWRHLLEGRLDLALAVDPVRNSAHRPE